MIRFAPSTRSRPHALTALAALGALMTMAALASPTAAAAGQPGLESLQTTVHYNLRDLATDPGTRALYRRIVSAARTVCPGYDSRELSVVAESQQCQRQAVARAVAVIGSARLAAVHAHMVARHG